MSDIFQNEMNINFENIFLGIAIGDAYGAGLEFQDRNWIREHVNFSSFINKRTDINVPEKEVFTIDYKEWDYTDDTEMSVAVAKAIVSGKPFTDDNLVAFFTDEYLLGYKLKGYKRNGHGSIRLVYSGEKSIEEIKQFQRDKLYPGNAPPMRAIPIGFVKEADIDLYARVNATSTHPHPKAIDASILIARATQGFLLKNLRHEELISYCSQFISDEETKEKLVLTDTLPAPLLLNETDYELLCGPQPLPRKSFAEGLYGLPSNAMYTAISALYMIKHSASTFEGLKNSIYLGGDVDSLASIVTGILAGRYGLESLPPYMLKNVEGVAYLKSVAEDFRNCLNKKTQ
jgi:ADP-ribosylglycohydrolase